MDKPGIRSPVFLLERIASLSGGDIRKLDLHAFVEHVQAVEGIMEDFERARFDEAPGFDLVSRAAGGLARSGFTIQAINILAKCAWAANRCAGAAEGARFLEAASRLAIDEENLHLARDLMDQAMMMNGGGSLPALEAISGELHLASSDFHEAASVFSHLSERLTREELGGVSCPKLQLARAYVGIAAGTDDERRREFFLSRAEEFLDQCGELPGPDERLCASSMRASVRLSRGQTEPAGAILESADLGNCGLGAILEHCRMRAELAVLNGDRKALLAWCREGFDAVSRLGFSLHSIRQFREIEKLLNLGQTLEPASEARAVFFTGEGMDLLASAVAISDSRDEYLQDDHSKRVMELSVAAAGRVLADDGLNRAVTKERLEAGALLHDIGKLLIPWRVINSIEPISSEEKTMFRKHPVKGADLCRAVGIDSAARMVAEHHEEFDGSGYPEGTDQISRLGLILSTVNGFVNSTMSCRRTRAQAAPPGWVLEAMKAEAGRRYDPAVLSGLEQALSAE